MRRKKITTSVNYEDVYNKTIKIKIDYPYNSPELKKINIFIEFLLTKIRGKK